MGSTPTTDPIPWQPPPYNGYYRDCSFGICTIYCPQWCTLFFPPPPDSSGSDTYFSPLVVSVIVILVSALLLVSYFTIFKKSCGRGSNSISSNESRDRIDNVLSRNASPAGLEESAIKSIAVWKYKKGEGIVEGTDCSVCLSEFKDDESLRVLPKCNHAFHLPCIDTWLKSHPNCPLCRANVAPSVNSSPMPELPPTDDDDTGRGPAAAVSSTESVAAIRRDEVVVTVFEDDGSASTESVSCEGEVRVISEQHAEDGNELQIKPQNIGPSKSFHGENSNDGSVSDILESGRAISTRK